ncbi:MAG: Rrf2 family transcriptional regulator [Nanoarchaeota archaeon]
MNLIEKNKSISAREIAECVGISQRAVEKHLAILKKKGIIKRVGGAKGGHWENAIRQRNKKRFQTKSKQKSREILRS